MVKRHHQSQPANWQVITFGRIQTLTTELNNRNAREAKLWAEVAPDRRVAGDVVTGGRSS
jgi:hypothetical protein